MAKNEISETIAEREIIKLKPRSIYSLLKKIKASKIYHKYISVEMDQFKIQWTKPPEFQSDSYLYEKISQLDEADQFLTRDLFSDLRGNILQFSSKYMVWHCRSFLKPLLEVWGWHLKM